MKRSELKQLIKEEITKILNENLPQDPLKFIEDYGFVKIKNKEEYLQVIPILQKAGYSFVGGEFPINPTPFDVGYGAYGGKPGSSGRKQERKNAIYLTTSTSLSKDKSGKYDKYLWLADYLNKNRTSDKFPIGTPSSY